jgi:hypothetical protein
MRIAAFFREDIFPEATAPHRGGTSMNFGESRAVSIGFLRPRRRLEQIRAAPDTREWIRDP